MSYVRLIIGVVTVIIMIPIIVYMVNYMLVFVSCRTKITEIVRDDQGRIIQIIEKCMG